MVSTATETYAVEVEHDVPARMRDGTILRADVYRPKTGGPFPAVVERTPYGKRKEGLINTAKKIAARGYIAVVQDTRGRFASDGEFDPMYSETRGDACILDGYDTVEWAATLANSTKQVGTYGGSYSGWTQLKLAPTRPPHLVTMVMRMMCPDSRSVWPGIFTRERQLRWNICSMASDTRRRLGQPGPQTPEEAERLWETLEKGKWLWFEPMSEFPEYLLAGMHKFWHSWLRRHNEDWFHFDETYSEMDVPIYHITAWYDRFIDTIQGYNAVRERGWTEHTRKNQRLIIGPWSHGIEFSRKVGVMDYGPDAEMDYAAVNVQWFDYWMKGIDTGIMDGPPIRLFVMGRNAWRSENEWPLARTQYVDYHLHSVGHAKGSSSDGSLSTQPAGDEPADRYIYDPRDPMMSIYLPSAQFGPGDVRVQNYRHDNLVYRTAPLERDVEVTGEIELTLYAATSAPDTDWTAMLIDEYPDGFAVNLCSGIVRARYRESWDQPTLLEPGRVYEYHIRLKPTSNVFKAGHRIRLDVSSSDFPNFDRNHNTGRNDWEDAELRPARQSVFHSGQYPSRLRLPIIP